MAFPQPAFAKHLSLFLCVKYLCRKKIVLLSIAAVMMSSALIIVVASLFSGFIDAIGTTVADHSGDIVITCPAGIKIPEYGQLIADIEQSPNVDSATAVLSGYGGLLYLGKGNVRAVKIIEDASGDQRALCAAVREIAKMAALFLDKQDAKALEQLAQQIAPGS